jgi:N-acyl homoserine lactone hydrolase
LPDCSTGDSPGIGDQLRAVGYSPDDVRLVVLSHLHQDHIGGLGAFPKARIVVAEAEWRQIGGSRPELRGYLPRHIDLPGLDWQHVTFAPTDEHDLAPFSTRHDLVADGSLVLIPTPGHTKGSLSMVVRSLPTPLLLVGDLTYDVALMERGKVPGIGDRAESAASTKRVMELAARLGDAAILPAHDPRTATRLRAAGGRAL